MTPGFPCCCEADATCDNCDEGTTPGSITVTFGTGLNNSGDQSECTGDCDDFSTDGPFELALLSQAEVDSLNTSCPNAFLPASPTAGCFFGLTEGLPCGCDSMVIEIIDGGTAATGTATGNLTMCWGVSISVTISWTINTDDTDQDCLTNIDTNGGGVDNASVGVAGSPECDFDLLIFDFTKLDLVANA